MMKPVDKLNDKKHSTMNNRNRFFFFLLVWFMPLVMTAQTNHWTPQSAAYEDNMTLTGVVQINGVEQQSTALEVGAFCGSECRGSARAVLFPATGRYIVLLTLFGNNGDQITFKLYDHSQGLELNFQSPDAITFGSNGLGSVVNPYVLNFTEFNYTITVSASPSNGGTVSGAGTYQNGSTCTLTATPNTGYSFVRWMKNGNQVSTNHSYSFTVTANASYVAEFSLNSYTISVSANPSAGGMVSGAGEYNHGASCTLTATPNEGYNFVRWTKNGSQVSTNPSYCFTVTESASYVAVFSQNSYTISVSANPSASGTVSGGGTYNYGSTCTLTATSATGYTFSNWTENGEVVSTEATYSFTVTGDRNLVSNFDFVGEIPSIELVEINGITYDHICFHFIIDDGGSAVSIAMVNVLDEAGNWLFGTGWADPDNDFWGCRTNLSLSPSTTYIFQPYADNSNGTGYGTPVTYTTLPAPVFYTINATVNPEVGGTVSGVGVYEEGSTCTLTATPNVGYAFVNWTENDEVVSAEATYSFTVTENASYVAVFSLNSYTVSASANPSAGGTVSGGGTYNYGSNCTLTATANTDYTFTNWTENGEVVSTEATYSFAVTGDRDLVANFQFHGDYIIFADSNVKAICVVNWDTNGDGELSYDEAAAVTDIGWVFYYNQTITSFEELRYFTGLTSINEAAFYGCTNMTGNLYIPNSVTAIGTYAFGDCTSLTGDLIIPNSVTTIGVGAFYNCNGFTGSLIISNSINSIEDNVFYGCSGFTGDLVIPNSVASIGSYAFGGCSGFTGGLTIPNSVTTIGEGAFGYCNGFTSSLVIPNSVVSIGDAAFENCSGFTGPLIIPNSVSSIGYYAFDDCSGFTGDLVIPNSVTMIGVGAFFNCNGFTGSLIISNSVNSIEDYVFYGCSGFTGDLVIPNSVASIGNYAFRDCSGFTGGLTIPNSVTTIGEGAFNNCNGFTGSLTISNSVTSIEGYTFSGCWGFTGSLTIPNSVTTIGERAFYNCCGLTSMTIGAEIPPTLDQDVFSCVPETIPVYVPCGSLEAYQIAEGWNEFTNYQYLDCSYHFITAGNWSEVSSWSKGTLPGVDHEVFIDAPCQLDQDAKVANLTVSDGQSLTLQSGKTLTVTNILINTVTTGLIIEDGAQLVHASENVIAMVKKNITGYGTNRGKYALVSNPLSTTINPELASIYHLTRGNYDLYDWLPNTPDNLEWRNYKDNDFLMLPDGYGYLYANQNGVELNFSGTLKPSNNRFGKSVSYDSSNTEHPGWNLIGNPFMCNAYLVNENNELLPFYRMNSAGDGFELVTSGAIAPMEGVFYKASGNEVVYFIRTDFYSDTHAYVDLGLPSGCRMYSYSRNEGRSVRAVRSSAQN